MIVGDVPREWKAPTEYGAPQVFCVVVRPPRRGFLGTTFAIVALVVLLPIVMLIICWAAIIGIGERLATPGHVLWLSPVRLADFAAFISGPERADDLRAEWRTHLAGETGAGMPKDRQVRVATGLVVSALRYRLQDLADLLGQPVDAVLRSRQLSGLLVVAPTLGLSVLFMRQGGLYGLADHLEDAAVMWGAAMGLIHLGRMWRDVRPPERKPWHKSK